MVENPTWYPCSYGGLPLLPIKAGVDADGHEMFVGRCYVNDEMLLAKIICSKLRAFAVYKDNEVAVEVYEALSACNTSWIPAANGNVPSSALIIGEPCPEKPIFAGRAYYNCKLYMGQVHPAYGCYCVCDGIGTFLLQYQVLSLPDQWTSATADSIPLNAYIGGWDEYFGIIYVGRALINGVYLPAQIIPSQGCALVTSDGCVYKVLCFDVLRGESFTWLPCNFDDIYHGAVPVSHASNGETLYIGRAKIRRSLLLGRITPSKRCLLLPDPDRDREIRLVKCEILVRS